MAQFVKCATCGKPYLDKGSTACPHCARAGRPVTPPPASVPKPLAKPAAPAAKAASPAPPPASAESGSAAAAETPKSPAPEAAEREEEAQPSEEPPASGPDAEPAHPVSPAAATMIAISAVPVPEPAAAPPAASADEPPAATPVAPAPPRPAPPRPAEIPVAAKTLVFAPIAPPAEPASSEPRPAARPVPIDTPTRQTGSMEVRPMRVTPVVGVAKVITRATGPLDLATLTPPPGGGKRLTADVIGAPKPPDPQDKTDARARPAHAEGVRVVVPDAPVLEVGHGAPPTGAESGKPAEPIRALRVRLTQELQIVKPPEPSKKKVVVVAALGGMGAALLIWLLVSLIW